MIGQTNLFAPDVDLPLRRRVCVELVTTAQARHTLENFHYLHRARVGRQLNYAVEIDGVTDGIITFAYPMMSAELCGVASDELVEFTRLYLHRNVPHSASCAIGKTLRRIQQDWAQLFPESKPLRLVVSWSDTHFHVGTVYKASNFTWLRKSEGWQGGNHKDGTIRGRRTATGDRKHLKDCWIYWLQKAKVSA